MKSILIGIMFLILAGCSHSVKIGKKCTPGHQEWSYVWIVENNGDNISKENCKRGNNGLRI